jgi:hypothetical protein
MGLALSLDSFAIHRLLAIGDCDGFAKVLTVGELID